MSKELLRANFEVTEIWTVDCPICGNLNQAPLNKENPMEPLEIDCEACGAAFIVTYERES